MELLRARLQELNELTARFVWVKGAVLPRDKVLDVRDLLGEASQHAEDLLGWTGYWPEAK